MIEPLLTALLASPEKTLLRHLVEIASNVVPLV